MLELCKKSIDKSEIYKKLKVDKIKSVEFIRIKDNELLFVEAKTTFPNPNKSEENFKSEIEDICDKFIHSLNLFSSVKVGVTEELFPRDFIMPEKSSLVFVLVIKNHQLGWCNEIYRKLIDSLPSYLKKIWRPEVYVINHETAIKRNLASVS